MRTIEWHDGAIRLCDQTRLPHERVTLELGTVDDLIAAIQRLAVRGAPALGAAGALGVALAARTAAHPDDVRAAAARLAAARPTAVNLATGVHRALARLPEGADAVLAEAEAVLAEDAAANRALAERGAGLLLERCGDRPLAIHTHCNTGALACVEWGTALGIVRTLHERGRIREVIADETRPLLQGARLTAFELAELGIPYRLVVDGAGPAVIARGLVDAVVVGADRIAANGDVANKVGTYPLALAARRAGIPFVVAAPEATLDPGTPDGAAIDVEERPEAEVLAFGEVPVAPAGARALNLAFDVTPADLVTAIVTEQRTLIH